MKRPVILKGGVNDGNRIWKDSKNVTHRVLGPAVEWTNGYKAWYQRGRRIREGSEIVIEDATCRRLSAKEVYFHDLFLPCHDMRKRP